MATQEELQKLMEAAREEVLSEDEFLVMVSGVKTASPYTVNGATMVQAHVSPVESIRLTGAPNVDIQYTLDDNDLGVPHE